MPTDDSDRFTARCKDRQTPVPQMMRTILLLISIASTSESFAQSNAPFPCRDDDKACATKAAKVHVVTTLKYWQPAFAKPVEERIGSAPLELVQFLNLQNIKDGFPN
jgi:hypothetical protein